MASAGDPPPPASSACVRLQELHKRLSARAVRAAPDTSARQGAARAAAAARALAASGEAAGGAVAGAAASAEGQPPHVRASLLTAGALSALLRGAPEALVSDVVASISAGLRGFHPEPHCESLCSVMHSAGADAERGLSAPLHVLAADLAALACGTHAAAREAHTALLRLAATSASPRACLLAARAAARAPSAPLDAEAWQALAGTARAAAEDGGSNASWAQQLLHEGSPPPQGIAAAAALLAAAAVLQSRAGTADAQSASLVGDVADAALELADALSAAGLADAARAAMQLAMRALAAGGGDGGEVPPAARERLLRHLLRPLEAQEGDSAGEAATRVEALRRAPFASAAEQARAISALLLRDAEAGMGAAPAALASALAASRKLPAAFSGCDADADAVLTASEAVLHTVAARVKAAPPPRSLPAAAALAVTLAAPAPPLTWTATDSLDAALSAGDTHLCKRSSLHGDYTCGLGSRTFAPGDAGAWRVRVPPGAECRRIFVGVIDPQEHDPTEWPRDACVVWRGGSFGDFEVGDSARGRPRRTRGPADGANFSAGETLVFSLDLRDRRSGVMRIARAATAEVVYEVRGLRGPLAPLAVMDYEDEAVELLPPSPGDELAGEAALGDSASLLACAAVCAAAHAGAAAPAARAGGALAVHLESLLLAAAPTFADAADASAAAQAQLALLTHPAAGVLPAAEALAAAAALAAAHDRVPLLAEGLMPPLLRAAHAMRAAASSWLARGREGGGGDASNHPPFAAEAELLGQAAGELLAAAAARTAGGLDGNAGRWAPLLAALPSGCALPDEAAASTAAASLDAAVPGWPPKAITAVLHPVEGGATRGAQLAAARAAAIAGVGDADAAALARDVRLLAAAPASKAAREARAAAGGSDDEAAAAAAEAEQAVAARVSRAATMVAALVAASQSQSQQPPAWSAPHVLAVMLHADPDPAALRAAHGSRDFRRATAAACAAACVTDGVGGGGEDALLDGFLCGLAGAQPDALAVVQAAAPGVLRPLLARAVASLPCLPGVAPLLLASLAAGGALAAAAMDEMLAGGALAALLAATEDGGAALLLLQALLLTSEERTDDDEGSAARETLLRALLRPVAAAAGAADESGDASGARWREAAVALHAVCAAGAHLAPHLAASPDWRGALESILMRAAQAGGVAAARESASLAARTLAACTAADAADAPALAAMLIALSPERLLLPERAAEAAAAAASAAASVASRLALEGDGPNFLDARRREPRGVQVTVAEAGRVELPHGGARRNTVVYAARGFTRGVHYWQVRLLEHRTPRVRYGGFSMSAMLRVAEEAACVGVLRGAPHPTRNRLRVGTAPAGWAAVAGTSLRLLTAGAERQLSGEWAGHKPATGDVIGVLLDLEQGSVQFFIDAKPISHPTHNEQLRRPDTPVFPVLELGCLRGASSYAFDFEARPPADTHGATWPTILRWRRATAEAATAAAHRDANLLAAGLLGPRRTLAAMLLRAAAADAAVAQLWRTALAALRDAGGSSVLTSDALTALLLLGGTADARLSVAGARAAAAALLPAPADAEALGALVEAALASNASSDDDVAPHVAALRSRVAKIAWEMAAVAQAPHLTAALVRVLPALLRAAAHSSGDGDSVLSEQAARDAAAALLPALAGSAAPCAAPPPPPPPEASPSEGPVRIWDGMHGCSTRRALPARLCPRISHQLLGLSERRSGTSFRISLTHDKPLVALADANVPDDLPCYYFEVTLTAMPSKEAICMVAIGLKRSLSAAAALRNDTLPGWDKGGFGYVSDGLLFDGQHEPAGDTRRVAKGDTFGVGVFTAARQAFFTHNGELLHPRHPLASAFGPLRPAVGVWSVAGSGACAVEVNFGTDAAKPFKCNLAALAAQQLAAGSNAQARRIAAAALDWAAAPRGSGGSALEQDEPLSSAVAAARNPRAALVAAERAAAAAHARAAALRVIRAAPAAAHGTEAALLAALQPLFAERKPQQASEAKAARERRAPLLARACAALDAMRRAAPDASAFAAQLAACAAARLRDAADVAAAAAAEGEAARSAPVGALASAAALCAWLAGAARVAAAQAAPLRVAALHAVTVALEAQGALPALPALLQLLAKLPAAAPHVEVPPALLATLLAAAEDLVLRLESPLLALQLADAALRLLPPLSEEAGAQDDAAARAGPGAAVLLALRRVHELLRAMEARAPLPLWFVARALAPPPLPSVPPPPCGIHLDVDARMLAGMTCVYRRPYSHRTRPRHLRPPPSSPAHRHTHVLVAGAPRGSQTLQVAVVVPAAMVLKARRVGCESAASPVSGVPHCFRYFIPGEAFGFSPTRGVRLEPVDARATDGVRRLSWALEEDESGGGGGSDADDSENDGNNDDEDYVGGRCGNAEEELIGRGGRHWLKLVYAFTPPSADAAAAGAAPIPPPMLYSTAVAWPQVPPLPHFDAAAHDNGAWSADADAQLLRAAEASLPLRARLADVAPAHVFPAATAAEDGGAATARRLDAAASFRVLDAPAAAPSQQHGPGALQGALQGALSVAPPLAAALSVDEEAPTASSSSSSPPPPEPSLAQRPRGALAARLALLQHVSACAAPVALLLSQLASDELYDSAFGTLLRAQRGRLLPGIAAGALAFAQEHGGDDASAVTVRLDRGAAARATRAEHTLFGQLERCARDATFSSAMPGAQLWRAELAGEAAIDAGGPFRDTLRTLAAELCPEDDAFGPARALGLLRRVPNAAQEGAYGVDTFLPAGAAAATSPLQLRRFRFLGRLAGGCLLSNNPLEVTLAPPLWKALMGERCDSLHDLGAVDEGEARRLLALAALTQEDWAAARVRWEVPDGAGGVRPVPPGGLGQAVAWAQRHAYVVAAAAAHAAAWRPAAEAMRQGLADAVAPDALALMTWRDLERRVCGARAVTLDLLRAMADDARLAKHAQQHEWFWRLAAELSDAQRGALLAFATGRSRAPAAAERGQLIVDVTSSYGDEASGGDARLHLPTASTCGYTLHLPAAARTYEAMRDGVLFAIAHCNTIELDGAPRPALRDLLQPGDDDAGGVDGGAGAALDASASGGGGVEGELLFQPLFDDEPSGGDRSDDDDGEGDGGGAGAEESEEEGDREGSSDEEDNEERSEDDDAGREEEEAEEEEAEDEEVDAEEEMEEETEDEE